VRAPRVERRILGIRETAISLGPGHISLCVPPSIRTTVQSDDDALLSPVSCETRIEDAGSDGTSPLRSRVIRKVRRPSEGLTADSTLGFSSAAWLVAAWRRRVKFPSLATSRHPSHRLCSCRRMDRRTRSQSRSRQPHAHRSAKRRCHFDHQGVFRRGRPELLTARTRTIPSRCPGDPLLAVVWKWALR